MNWNFFKKKSDTSVEDTRNESSYSNLLLGNTSNNVTPDNAQKIAMVLACVNIKANALAVIPAKIYKETSNGREPAKEHPLYNLLHKAPNQNLPASLYKKMISQDLDLRGNHFSQIVRNGLGIVMALYPLQADKMEVKVVDGKKTFIYDGKPVHESKILHIFDIPDTTGMQGISRIEYAKESLKFAKSSSEHGNKLFENGATPTGVFETPDSLTDQAYERLQESLYNKYAGVKNSGKTMILEENLKYSPISLTNSDAQWLESRKLNREEVCGIFGVPSSMINDTANVAYGNLEQKYLEFYSGIVLPMLTILEEIFWMKLLREHEQKDHEIKFKYNAMLRVDTATRKDYYQTRFNTGSMSPNEIRAYEDENAFDGGNEYYLQMNLSTVKNLNKGNTNG